MPDRPPTSAPDRGPSPADGGTLGEKLIVSTPRLLCVHSREPSWVSLSLGFSSAGLGLPRLIWVSTSREALTRLRDEQFDCILIDVPPTGGLLRDENAPFDLIRALRTSGNHEPVVVIGRLLSDAEWIEACALDCDVFVSARGWNSPALFGMVKRAIVRGDLTRENHRLTTADHRRLVRERDESDQLLAQQRQIIAELEGLPDLLQEGPAPARDRRSDVGAGAAQSSRGPASDLSGRYAGLLRSYVLMGSGSLGGEIAEMAERILAARLPPPEALQLHLECVESLVKGLGNRSARHVVARADLLAVEMMTHVAHRTQQAAGGLGGGISPAGVLPFRRVTGKSGIDLSIGPADSLPEIAEESG